LSFENASIFDNDKLLALSVIVLMTGSEPDVTEMIADLMAGVTPELLLKLADKVAFRYTSYFGIRNNIEATFPDVTIGPLEGIIIEFWEKIYGLGECSKERAGALDTVNVENSVNDGKVLACKEIERGSEMYLWNEATDIDISTEGLELVEDGKLVRSKADSTVMYVYDSGRWRLAFESEIRVKLGCVHNADDSILVIGRGANKCSWKYCIQTNNGVVTDIPLDSLSYTCKTDNQPTWIGLNVYNLPTEYYFNEDVKYGSVTDERNKRTYRTVEIAGNTWMAENLAYEDAGGNCEYSSSIGCRYDWNTALSLEAMDTIASGKPHRGICMEGFHVPDSAEWKTVLESAPLDDLRSFFGWNAGNNSTGFSIVPMVLNERINDPYANFIVANYKIEDKCTDFACMNKEKAVYGYAVTVDSTTEFTLMWQRSKGDYRFLSANLRCVKDSE
jgi:uncharacterized protein (TIGR02145 family)